MQRGGSSSAALCPAVHLICVVWCGLWRAVVQEGLVRLQTNDEAAAGMTPTDKQVS